MSIMITSSFGNLDHRTYLKCSRTSLASKLIQLAFVDHASNSFFETGFSVQIWEMLDDVLFDKSIRSFFGFANPGENVREKFCNETKIIVLCVKLRPLFQNSFVKPSYRCHCGVEITEIYSHAYL